MTNKKVIEATLTTLLGTPYSINKVADLVGINEGRTINMDSFHISTSCTDCEVEETTITDDNFILTEGRYVDGHEHETMYHYVYVESTSDDWRFRLDVDAAGNLAGVKELCTVNHAIQLLKEEILGRSMIPLKSWKSSWWKKKGKRNCRRMKEVPAWKLVRNLMGKAFLFPSVMQQQLLWHTMKVTK